MRTTYFPLTSQKRASAKWLTHQFWRDKSEGAIRGQAAHRHLGAPSCVKAPVTSPAISCCSVHTLNAPTPVPPILPASLLHGAPRPSCISMLYERWRGGNEGLGARESMEGGLGSAVRPRQQSESIKSVGLLLHWVVINRSWTLSPARRADRVNEGPKAAPHPPPSSHPNSLFPLPPLSLPPLSHLPSFGWSSKRKSKEAKMPVLLLAKRAKTRSWSSGFEQSQRSVAYSAERNI